MAGAESAGSRLNEGRTSTAHWVGIALGDVVASLRSLRSRPAYVLVATLTLGLGIGSSVLVFSVIDAIALAPLPYEEPERLAALYERSLEDPDIDRWPVTPATYLDWRQMSDSFATLSAYDYASPIFADGESARRIRGILVSGDLFATLGASPAMGRAITPADVSREAKVAVVSHDFWRTSLGGDEGVLGREILLDGEPTRIVGVMSEGFRFPYDSSRDLWRPLVMSPEMAADRSRPQVFVVGRLREGVTHEQARQEMESIAATLAERHPEESGGRGATLVTMREDWLEWRRPALQLFAVAMLLTLAIACLNLAGLMLSRGLARVDEISLRAALGAGRARISWLLVAEALAVAIPGVIAGCLLAAGLLPWLLEYAPTNWGGALLADVGIDARVLTFAVLIGMGTAVLAGLVPAVRVARGRVGNALQGSARTAGGVAQMRVRRGLVLVQAILAVLLLGEAGMLGRSVLNVFSHDVGISYDNVITARIPVQADLGEPAAFYDRLVEEAGALPGVQRVALASIVPLSGGGWPVAATTDGTSPVAAMSADTYNQEIEYRAVGEGFFEMLEIPLLRGRHFAPEELRGGERVALVNEEFVRRVLNGGDPVGASVRVAPTFYEMPEGFDDPLRIVGVVGDVAEWGVWMSPPMIYVPYRQSDAATTMTVMMRTGVTPASVVEPFRELVWDLGNRWPVENVQTLEGFQSRLYQMHRFMLALLALFATAAVVLAATGLYGVISLQVGMRTREMSIRRALGAQSRDVLGSVLREGLVLAMIGALVATGLGLAISGWIGASWMGNFLFEVDAFDPVSFGVAVALLVVTSVVSCTVPARRAAAVDPALALKSEQ